MIKTYAVYKKEVASLFFSPIAYVSIALFLFLVAIFTVNNMNAADLRDVFGYMSLFMIFVIPMATMRALSEEMRTGTEELLMTSPLGLGGIVAGKFLAVMTLILTLFALTLQYVILVAKFGKPDWGPVFTGYIGMFLLCGAFTSVGIFTSSLTKNQFIAAVVSFVIILFFMVIDTLANFFGPGAFGEALSQLAIYSHLEDFDKGLLDLSHVIYYIGFTFLFLFFTVRNLETRRW